MAPLHPVVPSVELSKMLRPAYRLELSFSLHIRLGPCGMTLGLVDGHQRSE